MKKTRLRTFTTIERKKHVQISGNAAKLKADRSLFGRMIVIAHSRQLNMRAIFAPTWPNTMGIGYAGRFPQKKNSKAVLAHHLQKGVALAECIPDKSVTVIGGLSLVQKVGQNHGTFG